METTDPNCSLCDKPAAGEFKFRHDDKFNWYCTVCLMERVARQDMMGSFRGRSMPSHHYSKEEEIECKYCGRQFPSVVAARVHETKCIVVEKE